MTKTPLTDAINDSMEGRTYYPLFKHMADNHDLTLLETELSDIVNVVKEQHPINWDALRDKLNEFVKHKIYINKAGLDEIFNFFKTEIK